MGNIGTITIGELEHLAENGIEISIENGIPVVHIKLERNPMYE